MSIARSKLFIGGAAIALAGAYLGFTSARGGWVYYVDVDTYLAEHAGESGERVRIHGTVDAEGVEIDRLGLRASFGLMGSTGRMEVAYRGTIPDMFEGGREVIVEGRAGAGGAFEADVLLTKCASKYQGAAARGPGDPGATEVERGP